MNIQDQVIEWYNCAEDLDEKLEIIRTLTELARDLTIQIQEEILNEAGK